jgi:hypothetical protein
MTQTLSQQLLIPAAAAAVILRIARLVTAVSSKQGLLLLLLLLSLHSSVCYCVVLTLSATQSSQLLRLAAVVSARSQLH